MKKLFIIIFSVFLFSCGQNTENLTQTGITSENTSQTIDNNSRYIGANIVNSDNLQISELSFGSKGYSVTNETHTNSSYEMSYFFGAKSNYNENIEFFTNTENNDNFKALVSLWSEENWQEFISQNLTATGKIITYNLLQLIPQETLTKHNDSFEITHTNTSSLESSKNSMIIDITNLQKFFTNDIKISTTIPEWIQKITYTTTDGQTHNYPIEKITQNTEYSETESHCGIDAPWCVLIFTNEEAKNIVKIKIEWIAPKQ